MPSRNKVRLQVYVPQDVIDLIAQAEDVIASTRSKIVEYAVRRSLGSNMVCVELTDDELKMLNHASVKNRRPAEQQAAVFIAEALAKISDS